MHRPQVMCINCGSAIKKSLANTNEEGKESVPLGQLHTPSCKHYRAPPKAINADPTLPTEEQVNLFITTTLATGKRMSEEGETVNGHNIIPFVCVKLGASKRRNQLMHICCAKSNCHLLPCILTRAGHGAARNCAADVMPEAMIQ